MTDNQESLGSYLRKERETKNISLEQVAYATRINLKMLMALEEDDHDALPAQTFVRGYLQAYAKYVKLDTQDVLLRYQHLLATTPVKQRSALKSHYVYVRERYQEKKQVILIISLFTLCLVSAGAYFALKSKRERGKHIAQQVHILQSPSEATLPGTVATPEAPPPPLPPATKEKEKEKEKIATTTTKPVAPATTSSVDKKNFSLALKAKEDVWVRFQADEDPVKDIMLKEDKTLILKANKAFKIFSGNLGAFEATLNGSEVSLLSNNPRAMSVVLPESETANYPLPLFPQFVKKEAETNTTPATPTTPAKNP